jgi:hypothetical protein
MISDKFFNALSITLGALAAQKLGDKDVDISSLKKLFFSNDTLSPDPDAFSSGGTFFSILQERYERDQRSLSPMSQRQNLSRTIEDAFSEERLTDAYEFYQRRYKGTNLIGGVEGVGLTQNPKFKLGSYAISEKDFIGQQAEAARQTMLDIMTNKRFGGIFEGTPQQRSYQSLMKKLESKNFTRPMTAKQASRSLTPLLSTFANLYQGVQDIDDVFIKRLHGNQRMHTVPLAGTSPLMGRRAGGVVPQGFSQSTGLPSGPLAVTKFASKKNNFSNVSTLKVGDLTKDQQERFQQFESIMSKKGVDVAYNAGTDFVEIEQDLGSGAKKFRYAQVRLGAGKDAESLMVPLQDIGDYTDTSTGAGIYHRDRVGSVMYSPTGKVLEINQKKESTLRSGMEYLFGTEAVRRDGTVYRKGGAIFDFADKAARGGQGISSAIFGGKDVDAEDQYKILQYIDPARTPHRALAMKAAQMKVVRKMNPAAQQDVDPNDSNRLGEFDEIQAQAAKHGYQIEPISSPNQVRKDVFYARENGKAPAFLEAALGPVDPSTGDFFSRNEIERRPARNIISAYGVQERGSQKALNHLRATLGDLYAFRGSGAFADMEKSGMIGFVHGTWFTTKRGMKEGLVPEGTRIRVGEHEGEKVIHPGRHFKIDKFAPGSQEGLAYNPQLQRVLDLAETMGSRSPAERQAAIAKELSRNPIFLGQGDFLGKRIEGDSVGDVNVDVPGQGDLAVLDVIPGQDDFSISLGRVSEFGEGIKTFGATTSSESSLVPNILTDEQRQRVKDLTKEKQRQRKDAEFARVQGDVDAFKTERQSLAEERSRQLEPFAKERDDLYGRTVNNKKVRKSKGYNKQVSEGTKGLDDLFKTAFYGGKNVTDEDRKVARDSIEASRSGYEGVLGKSGTDELFNMLREREVFATEQSGLRKNFSAATGKSNIAAQKAFRSIESLAEKKGLAEFYTQNVDMLTRISETGLASGNEEQMQKGMKALLLRHSLDRQGLTSKEEKYIKGMSDFGSFFKSNFPALGKALGTDDLADVSSGDKFINYLNSQASVPFKSLGQKVESGKDLNLDELKYFFNKTKKSIYEGFDKNNPSSRRERSSFAKLYAGSSFKKGSEYDILSDYYERYRETAIEKNLLGLSYDKNGNPITEGRRTSPKILDTYAREKKRLQDSRQKIYEDTGYSLSEIEKLGIGIEEKLHKDTERLSKTKKLKGGGGRFNKTQRLGDSLAPVLGKINRNESDLDPILTGLENSTNLVDQLMRDLGLQRSGTTSQRRSGALRGSRKFPVNEKAKAIAENRDQQKENKKRIEELDRRIKGTSKKAHRKMATNETERSLISQGLIMPDEELDRRKEDIETRRGAVIDSFVPKFEDVDDRRADYFKSQGLASPGKGWKKILSERMKKMNEGLYEQDKQGFINQAAGAEAQQGISNLFGRIDPSFAGSQREARTMPFTTFVGEGRNYVKGNNIRQVRTQQESAVAFLLNKGNQLSLEDIRNYAGPIELDNLGTTDAGLEAAYGKFHSAMQKGMGEAYTKQDTNALISFMKRSQDAFAEDPSLAGEKEDLLGAVFGFEQDSEFQKILESDPNMLLEMGFDQDFIDNLSSGIKKSKMVFGLGLHGVADSSSVALGKNARMERRFIEHIYYQLGDEQSERFDHMKNVFRTMQQRVRTIDPRYKSNLQEFAAMSALDVTDDITQNMELSQSEKQKIMAQTKNLIKFDSTGTGAVNTTARRKMFNKIKSEGGYLQFGKEQIYIPGAELLKGLSVRDTRAGKNVEDDDLFSTIDEILKNVETNLDSLDSQAFMQMKEGLSSIAFQKGMEVFNAPIEGRLGGTYYHMVMANLDEKKAAQTKGYGLGLSRQTIKEHFDEARKGASKQERQFLKQMEKEVIEGKRMYTVMAWQNPQIGPESVGNFAAYYDARRDKTGGITADALGETIDSKFRRMLGFMTGKSSSDFDGDTAAVMMVGAGDKSRVGKNITEYWNDITGMISSESLDKQRQRQRAYEALTIQHEKTLETSLEKLLDTGSNFVPTRKQAAFLRQVGQEDVGLISNTVKAMHRMNYIMKQGGGIERQDAERLTNFLQALEQKAVGFKHGTESPRKVLYERMQTALSEEDVSVGYEKFTGLLSDLGFKDASGKGSPFKSGDEGLMSFAYARESLRAAAATEKSDKVDPRDIWNNLFYAPEDSQMALYSLDKKQRDMVLNLAYNSLPASSRKAVKRKLKDIDTQVERESPLGKMVGQLNATERAKAEAKVKNKNVASKVEKELQEQPSIMKSILMNKFSRVGLLSGAVMAGAYAMFNSGYDDEPLTDIPTPPPGRMAMNASNADMEMIDNGTLLSDNYRNYNQSNDREMAMGASNVDMSGVMSSPNMIQSKSYLNNSTAKISSRSIIVDRTNPIEYARAIQGIIPGSQVGVNINHNYKIPSDLEREL